MKRRFDSAVAVSLFILGVFCTGPVAQADNSAVSESASYLAKLRSLRSQIQIEEGSSPVGVSEFKPERGRAFAARGIAEAFYIWYIGIMGKVKGVASPDWSSIGSIQTYYKTLEEQIGESESADLYKEAAMAVRAATKYYQGLDYTSAHEKWRESALGFLLAYALEDNLDPETWGEFNFTKAHDLGMTWWSFIWERALPEYGEVLRESGNYRKDIYELEIAEVRPLMTEAYSNILKDEAMKGFAADPVDFLKVRRNVVRLKVVRVSDSTPLQERCDREEREWLVGMCKECKELRDWLQMRKYARELFHGMPELDRPELDRRLGEQLVAEAEQEYRQETLDAYERAKAQRNWQLACEKAIDLQEVAPDLSVQLLKEVHHEWAAELLQQLEHETSVVAKAKMLEQIFSMEPDNLTARKYEGEVAKERGGSTFTAKAILDGKTVPATMTFGDSAAQWRTETPVPGFRYGEKFDVTLSYSGDGVSGEGVAKLVFLAIGPGEPKEIILKAGAFTATLPGGIKLRLEKMAAGEFRMGHPDAASRELYDETPHTVRLTQDFWIGKYEVTQAQWKAVMGTNPSKAGWGDDYPVDSVTWEDAMEFCRRLNEDPEIQRPEGYSFSLPTEAQWEYACRAGTGSELNSGKNIIRGNGLDDELNKLGWFSSNSLGGTMAVGLKAPNAWGLYDMHGNVWEWCRDKARNYNLYVASNCYGARKCTNPVGTEGSERVVRGGSWINKAFMLRSSFRMCYNPGFIGNGIGFRVALVRN